MFLSPRKLSRLYLQQENSTNVVFLLSLAHTCGYCLLEGKKITFHIMDTTMKRLSLSQPASPPGVMEEQNKSLPTELQKAGKQLMI